MELSPYFKSIVDQDQCPVVICDLDHQIIYMNPGAKARYANRGGAELLGKSLMECHSAGSREMLRKVLAWFQESRDHNIIYTSRNEKENKDVYMVALRDDEGELIGYYEKHEYRNRDTGGFYQFV